MSDVSAFHTAAVWMLSLLFAALAISLVLFFIRRRRQLADRGEETALYSLSTFAPGAFKNQELLDLLTLSAAWLWATDRSHHYVQITDDLLTHAGIDPDALTGQSPWRAPWKALTPAAWHIYHEHVQTRQPVKIIIKIPALTPNTGWRFFELSGMPVKRDGRFSGYHGIAQDITDRMNMSYALEESQAHYREVLNAVNEVVFRTDATGRLTQVNPAWFQMTSYSPQGSLGQPLLKFIHPDDQHTASMQLTSMISNRRDEFTDEFRLLSQDGRVRWVEARIRKIYSPGQSSEADTASAATIKETLPDTAGLVGTLNDITPRKVAEMTLRNVTQELEKRVRLRTAELEASNKELEAFSYSVSHDLRAPLRAIDGFACILEEDFGEQIQPEAATHLERIRAASQRMSDLIDSMIELARVTRQPLYKENVNLSEIAVQIIDELKAENPSRPVEVEITSGLMATCDRTLMRLVLENLIGNAWKFTAESETAYIRFTADHDGEKRVFCVSDNGAGFDMAFSDKLFRPFQRLHDSTRFPGSGIGLANVRKIIERHRGQIWADSSSNEGTHFFFTIGH